MTRERSLWLRFFFASLLKRFASRRPGLQQFVMTSSNSSGKDVKGGSANNNSKLDPLASLLKTMGGDDCDRPACDDTKSALTAALGRVDRSSSGVVRKGGGGSAVGDTSSGRSATAIPDSYRACPPTRDEIGVSTWSLLHSMVRAHSSHSCSPPRFGFGNFTFFGGGSKHHLNVE
jgi:hypothetical protein